LNNFRNGKVKLITTGNELQRIGITGSPSGISKDGRVEDGRTAEISPVEQNQVGSKREDQVKKEKKEALFAAAKARINKNKVDFKRNSSLNTLTGGEYLKPNYKRESIDPELNQIALDLSEMIFDEGDLKFSDYAAQMIEGIGEEVKPYLKQFYELTRYAPGMEGVEKMSTPNEVAKFDIDKFDHKEYISHKTESKKGKSKDVPTQTSLFDSENDKTPSNNESDTNGLGRNIPMDGSRELTKPTSEVGSGETERPDSTGRGENIGSPELGKTSDQQGSERIGSKGTNESNVSTVQPGNGIKPETDKRKGNASNPEQTPRLSEDVNETLNYNLTNQSKIAV